VKKLLMAAAALMLAGSAFAEMGRSSKDFVGRTNATSAVAVTMEARGLMYRASIAVSGTAKTNNIIILDGDGAVILSNEYTSGTTTTNFVTVVPFVGLSISSFGANTTAVTNTVTITNLR